MNDTELIDRCRLKALLRNGYDLGLIQTMERPGTLAELAVRKTARA